MISVELDANPQEALAAVENVLGPATLVMISGSVWTNPETGELEDKLHAHWRLRQPTSKPDRTV